MKKKKAPFALIAIVATMIAVGAVMNATDFFKGAGGHSPDDGHGHDQQVTANTASDSDREDAASALKEANVNTAPSVDPNAPPGANSKTGPYVSSVLLPKMERTNPVQNETVTSSQWYEEDALLKKQSDEKLAGGITPKGAMSDPQMGQ